MNGNKERGILRLMREFPRSVYCILCNEACERFAYHSIRSALVLYIMTDLKYKETTALKICHAFLGFAFITPLIGSILADSLLGKFKVILYGTILYLIGEFCLVSGSLPILPNISRHIFLFISLLVLAIATGGIKPCVSAFAADQIDKNDKGLLRHFFACFYFTITFGSFLAYFITPIFRNELQCFGSNSCYPAAFGASLVLITISLLFFLFGWKNYKKTKAENSNAIKEIAGCVFLALKRKISRQNASGCKHWLDRASPEYSNDVIKSVRTLIDITAIVSPMCVYWALFEQHISAWVIQAYQLNGRLGPFSIIPEQFNALNPLIVLLSIPFYEAFLFPFVQKFTKVTNLRKTGVGYLAMVISFLFAGCLQLAIDSTIEGLPPPGQTKLTVFMEENIPTKALIYNDAGFNLSFNGISTMEIPFGQYSLNLRASAPQQLEVNEGYGKVLRIYGNGKGYEIQQLEYDLDRTRNQERTSSIYICSPAKYHNGFLFLLDAKGDLINATKISTGTEIRIKQALLGSPSYHLYFGKDCEGSQCEGHLNFEASTGSSHVLFIHNETNAELVELIRPNELSLLWMFPQLFMSTVAEILVFAPSLEFAYSQSAEWTKSISQAIVLLTITGGNFTTVLLTWRISSRSVLFFTCAALMFLAALIFAFLANRYKPIRNATEKTINVKE